MARSPRAGLISGASSRVLANLSPPMSRVRMQTGRLSMRSATVRKLASSSSSVGRVFWLT